MNEIALAIKARQGDAEAFEDLLTLHSEQLYRMAYLYTGNHHDALDMVQETAYKGFLSVGKLRDERYFKTWLIRILINCCRAHTKKYKRGTDVAFLRELLPAAEELAGSKKDLLENVRTLKSEQREAIFLFYYQDLPIKEIAQVMKVPENTVKTHLRRGKEKLKTLLEGDDFHGQAIAARKI